MALALSRDGSRLATALDDTSVLLWDVSAVLGRERKPRMPDARKAPADFNALWAELMSTNGRQAQSAVWRLLATPEKTASWLEERLGVAEKVPAGRITELVTQLDSPRFAERQTAFEKLRELDREAEAALRRALNGRPSAEARTRIEAILAALRSEPAPAKRLREIRALQVLEAIATPQAIEVLKRLAKGAPGNRLTQDAQESLERALAGAK
jgi:hypothetical protein